MNSRKRELIEHLVRSIDYTKERILYRERLRTRESYDIFVRLNESAKDKNIKVVVTSSKVLTMVPSPWHCVDNVKVERLN